MLAREENRKVLHEALVWQAGRRLRAQQPKGQKLKQVTVDVDGLPVEVHGQQEGSAYNGHYGRNTALRLRRAVGSGGEPP